MGGADDTGFCKVKLLVLEAGSAFLKPLSGHMKCMLVVVVT